MKTVKKDDKREHVIVVVAPREKGTAYSTIMSSVIKAIDIVESNAIEPQFKDENGEWIPRESKPNFIFLHNGVTSGALNYVVEAVNKIGPLIAGRGRYVSKRKLDLDIYMNGKYADQRWFDQALEIKPDLILILDNKHNPMVSYAETKARQAGVQIYKVQIPYEPKEVII